MESHELIATCAGGLEEVLEREISGRSWTVTGRTDGAVRFRAGRRGVEEANLELRTCSRVLVPVARGRETTFNAVYRLARSVNWHEIAPPTASIAVTGYSTNRDLADSRFLALRVKDAIVDSQRSRGGMRSRVQRRNPDVGVVVHAGRDAVEISLDSSGRPLHMRGYRTESGAAPLRETVAAGMLMMAGWHGQCALIDPFCGSGTIAIEAAMISCNRAPGTLRDDYAFLGWPGADRAPFDAVRRRLMAETREPAQQPEQPIVTASDISAEVLAVARRNARRAGVENLIRFDQKDFFHTEPARDADGATIVMNPPYGERMDLPDAPEFYRSLGDTLKGRYAGCTAWLLSGNRQAMKSIGLRVAARIPLYNGGLESRLYRIDLYSSSGTQR
jgi:putative N6-adenine-specific DNA methylase